MTIENQNSFLKELRRRRKTLPKDLYEDLLASWVVAFSSSPSPKLEVAVEKGREPLWLTIARSHIGLKETPGKTHTKQILDWIKGLGGWFTDDETPWCGTFVAHCIKKAGLPDIPKNWYRAREWEGWGVASPPRVGAIVVFSRTGGGHVGFLVGENKDNYYVLGGNQSNMVNITPIAKARSTSVRWPSTVPLSETKLPKMSGGTVSKNEA